MKNDSASLPTTACGQRRTSSSLSSTAFGLWPTASIIVASHKPYRMPDDPMYLPIQVGAAGKESIGFQRDDEGDNISSRNPSFCELTGLYWAWKNLKADYIGLVHYRRHFAGKLFGCKWSRIITGEQLEQILKDYPAILPKKRHYYIETNYSQYSHAHHAQDLDVTRNIIAELYPGYLEAFDTVMNSRSCHIFNMFIMRYDLFSAYCDWLFDILFELESRLDFSSYSAYDGRVFGFVAERLLNVWIEKNNIQYKEMPYVFMEKQNWVKKAFAFLKRKLSAGD